MTKLCVESERINLPKNILCKVGMLYCAKSGLFPVISGYDEYGELPFLLSSSSSSSSSISSSSSSKLQRVGTRRSVDLIL
jgi:hypothetical protein